ncbi:MAG: amidohydrolase [bacterium]|jgi:predicted amidohydrolase YtcJ
MQASLVFVNGNVLTMDAENQRGEGVAVRGNRILAVGSNLDMKEYTGHTTQIIDLAGKTLLPGFSDNHLHMLGYGLSLRQVDVSHVDSLDEIVARVKAKAETLSSGRWVTGRGWDQNLFREKRYPSRQDLDFAAPDNPVALYRVCGHLLVANSRALELAGITKDTPDPAGGRIDRDPSTGEPTGILRETSAMQLVARIIPEPTFADRQAALRQSVMQAAACGITSITTDDVVNAGGLTQCVDLYRGLWESDGPAVRAYLLISSNTLDELIERGWKTGTGDERVKIGPLKIFQDGSLGARTAALLEPYSDDAGNSGVLYQSQEEINRLVSRAQAAGMQIGAHAIGDAAVASTLTALGKASLAHPRNDSRHRIIHYQILNPEILSATRRLGVIADIQPKFVTTDGQWLENRIGPERLKTACAWKTIIDNGIMAVAGSDCPVEPFDPLLGLHAAVTRRVEGTPEGSSLLPEQKLPAAEALKLFTINGAYGSFEEDSKGSIRPGKLADFVVLDQDPTAIPGENIRDTQIAMTIVDGQIKYSA